MERIVVHGEIVESLWEEDFTTAEDQQIVEDIRERLKLFGLDPDQAEEMVKMARQAAARKSAPTEPFLVQPHANGERRRSGYTNKHNAWRSFSSIMLDSR